MEGVDKVCPLPLPLQLFVFLSYPIGELGQCLCLRDPYAGGYPHTLEYLSPNVFCHTLSWGRKRRSQLT